MKKQKHNIDTIRDLHREGQLDEAKEGYLALLRKKPHDAEILHGLGILSAQQEDFSSAVDYLQTAAEQEPDNVVIQINLGNALKALGLFNQAIDILLTVVTNYPEHSHALNNLGAIYYAQGNIEKATEYYRLAIDKQPDYANAYYNLGLSLTKQSKFDDAIDVFKKLLQRYPEYAPASFQLGCLLLQHGKINDAIDYFLLIEKQHPHHVETQMNLATCHLKQGDLNGAKTCYINALELTPKDTQILFNLGVINMQQGYTDQAIQYYQRTLQSDADNFAAHNNIGVAFLAKNHIGFALHHFKEAERLQPTNEAIRYIVDMLSQNKRLLAAPTDYIKNLFDAYADHYEAHLLQGLDYQVPHLLLEAIQSVHHLEPSSETIVDLGCGTGLCGELFQSFAKKLVGVDISPNMLEIAKQKGIYNELITDNILSFLANTPSTFDIILAGDVVVYLGDLSALFSHIRKTVNKNGVFAFNTEMTEANDYTMNQSGRFAHRKNYIEQMAKENNLTITYCKQTVTRQQNNEPVQGYIYLLLCS